MNRDNLLFALIGIVIGFVAAYPAFEMMSARQPALRSPGEVGAAAPAGPGGEGSQPPTADRQAAAQQEVQRLREYVAANPDDADAVLMLANMNFDIRSFDRASQLYEQYLGLRPDDPNVLTDLGVSYRQMQQPDKALESFRRAREIAPDHWQALFNEIIVVGLDLGRFDEVSGALEELRRMQPSNPDVERLAQALAERATSS